MNFSEIPFAKDSCPCGYFPEKECTQYFNISYWFDEKEFIKDEKNFPIKQYYGYLKRNGFCRYSAMFYKYDCNNCKQCTGIRVPVNKFKPSKNQRAAWNKNPDIEVTLVKDSEKFVSEERALLFREYDAYHNANQEGFTKKTIEEALDAIREMNSGYPGVWNLEYRLNGRLIGVGIVDYTESSDGKIDALCSNYFYYEVSPEILKRSIGVFSVLKELELCKEMEIPYYYLGLYLPECHKMNYKNNYEPNEILIENTWLSSDYDFPRPGNDYGDICFITDEIELPVLLGAYRDGIFPWFNEDEGEPVLWQSPDPRFVIPVEKLHIPKTLKKFLKKSPYTYTIDKCFEEVITQCSLMRRHDQNGTWIGPKMIEAYKNLHQLGYAHSIEAWHGDKLVGGFYGELFGSLFCGESMFTIEDNSSSSAFVWFAQKFKECGGQLIDCQVYTDNMARYGAIEIPRSEYLKKIKQLQKIRLKKELKD